MNFEMHHRKCERWFPVCKKPKEYTLYKADKEVHINDTPNTIIIKSHPNTYQRTNKVTWHTYQGDFFEIHLLVKQCNMNRREGI